MTDYEKDTMAKTLEQVQQALLRAADSWSSPAAYGLIRTAGELNKIIEELRS